jgi:23S rRNA pseudouridine1911/1915/1917 synthase
MTRGSPAARLAPASGAAAAAPAGPRLLQLSADRAGERLDLYLARAIPELSRSAAQRLIEQGQVLVAGRMARAGARLKAGEPIEVSIPPPAPSELVPERRPLAILYEDADMLVLDKPAGVVVHPSAGHRTGTLVHALLAHCGALSSIGGEQRPGIVHRLDKDTSGLLLVAKNDRAHAALAHQLAQRTMSKHYLALVCGTSRPAEGVIEAPIARSPRDRKRMAIVAAGRPARTAYVSLGASGGYTAMLARLETGRTHQLRVHFAAIGCPIAGDPLYGKAGGPAGRLWLHAWRIAFDRPSGGERIVLEAPLPPELLAGCPVDSGRMLDRARRKVSGE